MRLLKKNRTADDVAYRGAFIEMIDYYLNQIDNTVSNPPQFQAKWNCDGHMWMW